MNEQAQQIIGYILKEVVRRPGVEIHEDTPLVSSGLIDSLELVTILVKLEDVDTCASGRESPSQRYGYRQFNVCDRATTRKTAQVINQYLSAR